MPASPLSPPPPRPTGLRGWAGSLLFRVLAPRLPRLERSPPPPSLEPWEAFSIARRRGEGVLEGLRFPVAGAPRGVVLLLHPWLAFGQTYFFRRGRIEALREAGYEVLTVDLPGFGASGPPAGLYDLDVEDALDALFARAAGRPAHLWGVSSGGYWAHPVLARRDGVTGAVFEDVSSHLLEWSWRTAPWGRPLYLMFRFLLPGVYRFLTLRLHAPHLRARAVAYVGGERDTGVLPADTRALAAAAGAALLLVPEAGHLGAIKWATAEVHRLALATFGGTAATLPRPALDRDKISPMKITGHLEDVGIAEVMQIIHFGARSGRLTIEGVGRHAEVAFHRGEVIQAWAEGSARLGDLLVQQGAIGQEELGAALEAQRGGRPMRALGRVLLDRGTVSESTLGPVLVRQIQGAINEIVRWRRGSYSFEVTDLRPAETPALTSTELVPGLRLEVPQLLAAAAAEGSGEHDDTHPLVARSLLTGATGAMVAMVAATGNLRVGPWSREALVAEFSPRGGEESPEVPGNLRMVEVGRGTEVVGAAADPAFPGPERVGVERLRRFLDEVRSGLYSATVSLSLMNIVAESAERGVLFLAREDDLLALGAFGTQWPAGTPLSSLLRDFQLEAPAAATLRGSTLEGARRVRVEDLPESFVRKIGPPRSGEAALVPVLGHDTLVALVYADNGPLDVPLRDLDLLEVVTAQVGLAFENEILRRRLRDSGR